MLGIYNFFTAFLIADHNVNLQNWLYQISTCKVYHNPHWINRCLSAFKFQTILIQFFHLFFWAKSFFYFRLSWVYILFHVRYYNSFPCPFQSFDFDILILFMMFRDSTDLHTWLCSIMLTLKNKDCLLKR